MVSRRRILSRSRDDLNLDVQQPEEDDVWYNTEPCFQEHIEEVFMKWGQIDDEIWSKVIVFERNRRVAKAYLRSPVLTINGTNIGFDGYRLGLSGFENPIRDPKTEEVISRQLGSGCKLRMDEDGNILVKRSSRSSNVYVKTIDEENAISPEVLRLPSQALELERPIKVFDIRKFEANIEKESRKLYPNRTKLEAQCILALAFAKNQAQLLQCPSWVMIINIVALDMLKSKLAPARSPPNIKNRPRLPVPEEDPYSLSGSSGGSNNGKSKPPNLPPREGGKSSSKGEYAYIEDSILRPFRNAARKNSKESSSKNDDPYYCGLRARTTNFKGSDKDRADMIRGQYMPFHPFPPPPQQPPPTLPPPPHHNMHHARSFDSGISKSFMPIKQMGKFNKMERNPMAWINGPQQQNYETDWENYWGCK